VLRGRRRVDVVQVGRPDRTRGDPRLSVPTIALEFSPEASRPPLKRGGRIFRRGRRLDLVSP
jgi:hypothetical protein